MNKIIFVTRWITAIPIGIAAGFSVSLLYLMIHGGSGEGSVFSLIISVIAGLFSGSTTAFISLKIIPSHRWIASIFLALFTLLFFSLSFKSTIGDSDLYFTVMSFSQDIGIWAICFFTLRKMIFF